MHYFYKAGFVTAAASIFALGALTPATAQERGTRITPPPSEAPTLTQEESEAALIDLVGPEQANALLTSTELTRNAVSPDTDPAFAPRRTRSLGLYGTLRDLRKSLSDNGSRRSAELSRLVASLDAAETALLGLGEQTDPTTALNDAMQALYAAQREGSLSRAQSSDAAEAISDAVYRNRVDRLQFAVERDAPARITDAIKTDIDNIKDILTRIGGDEAPPPFPNLKFGDAFDADDFCSGIPGKIGPIGQITGEVAGYAYSVWKDGQPYCEGAAGKARRNSDQPDLVQSPDKPLNSASTAKVLTTVAALKLLEGTSGVNLDTSIQNHLPSGWSKGAGLNMVSFRNLLSYCSGFLGMTQASADSYDDLKAIIAAGVNSNFCEYENANFGMFRVLIPTMTGNDPTQHYGPIQPLMAAVYYASWVNTNVLSPAGLSVGLCEDTTNYPTMYYRMSKPVTASGQYKPVDLLLCGGGGWYLSADDWSRFLSYVRHSNFLSQTSKKALYGDPLGYDGAFGDSPGVTWIKGGSWTTSEGAVRTCIFQSWNGVTATLLANSDAKSVGICSVLSDAFKEAWSFN